MADDSPAVEFVALPPAPAPPESPLAASPPAALSEPSLGRLLGALASRQGPVPKYLYPSAGTLYPIQAYVVLRSALGALGAGSYYHDPVAHELVLLSAATPAAPDGSTPAAMLLLIAQLAAIKPIYGEQAMSFCLLEAGYMTQALHEAADGLRLRIAGDPAAVSALVSAFVLAADHVPLLCWALGESD
jgi:hypothetical protein